MKNTDIILAARIPRKATEGEGVHTLPSPLQVAVAITTCLKLRTIWSGKCNFQVMRCNDVTAVKPCPFPCLLFHVRRAEWNSYTVRRMKYPRVTSQDRGPVYRDQFRTMYTMSVGSNLTSAGQLIQNWISFVKRLRAICILFFYFPMRAHHEAQYFTTQLACFRYWVSQKMK